MGEVITAREIRTLEFQAIREQLAEYTVTPMGRLLALELLPLAEEAAVRQALQETAEARLLRRQRSFVPPPCTDILAPVRRAARGGLLGGTDLVEIARFLAGTAKWKSFFRDPEKIEAFPLMASIAAALEPCRALAGRLERSVGAEGEILDGASPALAGLRRRRRTLRENLRIRMESYLRAAAIAPYLQEALVTRRGGRYVLPVKQEHRGRVSGIVHDRSASGATLFIEPAAVVPLHNEIIALNSEEEKEIQRILASLSTAVAGEEAALIGGRKIYAALDLVSARGCLSLEQDASAPQLSGDPYFPLVLVRARHPLLGKAAVPLELSLPARLRALVLTGPNTGGKTVTLKTVGLLAAMVQSGLHIPAAPESRLGIFRRIRADIGDEQSIVQSLSTFSGHMKNLIEIVGETEGGDLVLLDELGAGTDPSEGAALARSILEELAARGVLTLVTTHSSELKIFTQSRAEMQNASLEFDPETLAPTFRLLQGVPGRSNALAIAARLGLPAQILERAHASLDRDHGRVEAVIAGLIQDQQRYSRESREAARERSRAEALRRELESERESLRLRREKILQEAAAEARLLVRRAKTEADGILHELRRLRTEEGGSVSPGGGGTEAARGRMQQLLQAVENEAAPGCGSFVMEETPQVGKTVFVSALGRKGTIVSLDEEGALVQVGTLRVQAPRKDLGRCPGPPASAGKDPVPETGPDRGYTIAHDSTVRPVADLRGQTVEQALPVVEKLLDRALLAGLHRITLIHGHGTGRLKEELRTYLQGQSFVQKWRPGVPGEGGDGVTIITL